MATTILTKSHELVLSLSIPVSNPSDEAVWANGNTSAPAKETEYEKASTASSTAKDKDSAAPPASTCSHNHRSLGTFESDESSFEGDQINPARFHWMSHIPQNARRGLLLTIEPDRMRGHPVNFAEENAQDNQRKANKGATDTHDRKMGVIEDFCIFFSRELLMKLRDRQPILLAMANRTFCSMYVKKTLLLRGTWRTKTWTKYFMCRVVSKKRILLNNFYRLLEEFDVSFSTRYSYKQNQPRVTLVPNKTVPENTFLRMTRQRLGRCDFYFGQMPLLPDPYLSKLATKLTQKCINQQSLLAQMVVLE